MPRLGSRRRIRKVMGYKDLAKLAIAIERNLTLPQPNTAATQGPAIAVTM